MFVIPVLGMQRQKDQEFDGNLGCVVSLEPEMSYVNTPISFYLGLYTAVKIWGFVVDLQSPGIPFSFK